MTPITLKTERLILRRANECDAEILFKNYLSAPESALFLARKAYTDIEQSKTLLKTWCDTPWDSEQKKFAWVIANADKNEAIGLFLVEREDNHEIQIHYGISKSFENQGLMTEAGRAAIAWLSTQAAVKKIWALCDLDNASSEALLNKLGFRNEGVLKDRLILPAFGSLPRDCYFFNYPVKL